MGRNMSIQKSSIFEIADLALATTKKCISKNPETVVDIKEEKEEWAVTVEVLERKAIPDTQDLLGRYVIRLKKNGELIGWTQQMIRRRCDRTMFKQAAGEE
jgi:hypothetical protein